VLANKRVLLAGVGAVVLLGLLGGAVFAQATPTPAPAQSQQGQPNQTSYGQYFLDHLAAALGIQRSQLDAASQTAADQTIDKAQQDGQITQAQADQLKQRVAQNPNGALGLGRGFGLGGGKVAGLVRVSQQTYLQGVAQALNLSVGDLQTQLQSGQTVAQLAQQKNVSAAQVKAAVLAAVNARLDQAVQNGTVTSQQASDLRDYLNGLPASDYLTPGALAGRVGRAGGLGLLRDFGQLQSAAFGGAAQALGLTEAQLRSQLQSGQSLSAIARSHNVSADQIKSAVDNSVNTRLNQEVQDGTLTASQAQRLTLRLKALPAAEYLQLGDLWSRFLVGGAMPSGGTSTATPSAGQ
jgi:hypothetical protein